MVNSMVQILHNLYANKSMNRNDLYNHRLSLLLQIYDFFFFFCKFPYCLHARADLAPGLTCIDNNMQIKFHHLVRSRDYSGLLNVPCLEFCLSSTGDGTEALHM